MEGVIDLIYRFDDRIWIADYKTDMVTAAEVQARADHYRSQADIYSRAVTSSLGLSVSLVSVYLFTTRCRGRCLVRPLFRLFGLSRLFGWTYT